MTSEEKEKRAARAHERRVEEKATKEAWKALVDAHFAFLREQYGFKITSVETWVWGTTVTYETETTKLWVDRSVEFRGVEVWLQLKPDYPFPGQPVYVTMNLTHERIPADFIVQVRAPELWGDIANSYGLSDESIERRLALFARVLREYGDGLLRGNFSQIGQQRATMHNDVPSRQPVITVWVPDGTQKAQREEWMADVRRRSPDVRVIYRTYGPEPSPKRKAGRS